MDKRLFDALKAKCSDMGLSVKSLEEIAEIGSNGLTDESTKEQIDESVNRVLPIAKIMQSEATRWANSRKQQEPEKGGSNVRENQADKTTPDDLKAMIAAAISEVVAPLQQKLQTFEQKETQSVRQSFISGELKKLGIDEEDLPFLSIPGELDNEGITKHLTSYKQRCIDRGIPERNPFPQSKGEISKEQADDIVNKMQI